MSTVNEKMTTICDNIRTKTGNIEKLNLDEIATSIDEVYEAGQKNQNLNFWYGYLDNYGISNYSPYRFAGQGWNNETFYPPINITIKGVATGLFRECSITNLKQRLIDCGVTLDTSQATNLQYAFAYARFTHLPKISLISATNTTNCFSTTSSSQRLVWIEEIEFTESTVFANSFYYCGKLEHVIFNGTLATNGLNLQWSPQLDHESLLSILNCLKDYSTDTSGTDWFITIGADNIAKLSEEEKLIATNKGWDIR